MSWNSGDTSYVVVLRAPGDVAIAYVTAQHTVSGCTLHPALCVGLWRSASGSGTVVYPSLALYTQEQAIQVAAKLSESMGGSPWAEELLSVLMT